MPEGFFGGFAKTVGKGMLDQIEQQNAQEQQKRRVQFELLLNEANRADLKPEHRPVIMEQLFELLNAGGGKKGKEQFKQGVDTIMSMFEPAETSVSWNENVGELPTAGMAEAIPYPAGPGGETVFKHPVLPNQDLIKPVPIRGKKSETTISSPFFSREEMLQQKVEETKALATAKQDSSKEWHTIGEVFIDPKTQKRSVVQINNQTGEQRTFELPALQTEQEYIQALRNEGQKSKSGADYAKQLNTTAVTLAAAAGERNPTDPAVFDKYVMRAGEMLVQKGDLTLENLRAGIDYRRSAAQATRANMPQPGQPTAAAQRSFSQITTAIKELETEYNKVSKGKASELIGQQLEDGTTLSMEVINQPDGTKRYLAFKERKLQELKRKIDALKKERNNTQVSGPPARQGSFLSLGQRGQFTPNAGEHWVIGQIITWEDGTQYKVTGPPVRGGKYPVQRIK